MNCSASSTPAAGLPHRKADLESRIVETAVRQPVLSVEEYLELEESGNVRHEYIGGVLHAMAGATLGHTTIVTNISAATHPSSVAVRANFFRSMQRFT